MCKLFQRYTRTTQNDAVPWKSTGLGMEKPPVGAGTFCSLPILINYILPGWKYFLSPEQNFLRAVTGKFRKSLKL